VCQPCKSGTHGIPGGKAGAWIERTGGGAERGGGCAELPESKGVGQSKKTDVQVPDVCDVGNAATAP